MTAKVVAEVGLDPTEAALAELYAYVQSQPESEVKKKWVHKFNKENGCGTPKVILNSSLTDACAKNCKNLSQSIRVSVETFTAFNFLKLSYNCVIICTETSLQRNRSYTKTKTFKVFQ